MEHCALAVEYGKQKATNNCTIEVLVQVLDSLDNAAGIVPKRRVSSTSLPEESSKTAPSGQTTHWPGTQQARGLQPGDFFDLAVIYQLERYVRAKVDTSHLTA